MATQVTPDQVNLSGKVTSFTNTGTAAGTFYYVNNGGIKEMWGATGALTAGSGVVASGTVIPPTSFFTTIQSVTVNTVPSGDNRNNFNTTVVGTSSITVAGYNFAAGTGGANQVFLFVRGT